MDIGGTIIVEDIRKGDLVLIVEKDFDIEARAHIGQVASTSELGVFLDCGKVPLTCLRLETFEYGGTRFPRAEMLYFTGQYPGKVFFEYDGSKIYKGIEQIVEELSKRPRLEPFVYHVKKMGEDET